MIAWRADEVGAKDWTGHTESSAAGGTLLAKAIIAVSRQDSRDPQVLKRLALQMMRLP
jgi:hypothetical protein